MNQQTACLFVDVANKIGEAERFLERIKKGYPNLLEVKDNLSAFLCATNSIPDYLLEEYNKKYNLGISKYDKKFYSTFKKKAKESSNPQILDFWIWFDVKMGKIKRDQIGGFMCGKRNLDIHSSKISDSTGISVNSSIGKSATISLFNTNTPKRIQKEMNKLEKHKGSKGFQSSAHEELSFTDLSDDINVIDACEQFLYMMKNFVLETQRQFV